MGHDAKLNPFSHEAKPQPDVALDALGRPLQEGDVVLLQIPRYIHFRVAKISPVLDPRAPANLLHVHLASVFNLTVRKGDAITEIVRVAEASEAGPMPIAVEDEGGAGTRES